MLSRRSILFLRVALTTVSWVILPCIAGKAAELLIDNSPEKILASGVKAQLHGVRVVTTSPNFSESVSYGVTVPENVIVEAVKVSPELREKLNLPTDPNAFTFSMIAEAAVPCKQKMYSGSLPINPSPVYTAEYPRAKLRAMGGTTYRVMTILSIILKL
jgi:hypothetical protein